LAASAHVVLNTSIAAIAVREFGLEVSARIGPNPSPKDLFMNFPFARRLKAVERRLCHVAGIAHRPVLWLRIKSPVPNMRSPASFRAQIAGLQR
jgi:hypothetical protein